MRVLYDAMMKGPVQWPSAVRRTGSREPTLPSVERTRECSVVDGATSARSALVGSAARSGLRP